MKTRQLVFFAALIGIASSCNADLIGWYSFETDGTDSSGAGNDGTVSGDVAFPGGGNGFDGNDAASFGSTAPGGVIIPLDVNPVTHPQLTVGMWVRADPSIVAVPGLHKVFGHDNGGWDRGFGLDQRTDPNIGDDYRWCAFTGGAGPGPTFLRTGTAVTSDWTFVATTWDAVAGTITVHADGNFVTEAYTPTTSSHDSAKIGGLSPGLGEAFVGLIDEVFIVDHVMTPTEVQDVRTNGAAGIAALQSANPTGRALAFEYNFDSDTALSGSIVDWTNLGGGDAFNDQPANNTTRNPNLEPHSLANYIGTYENPGETGTDASTGTLESGSWVLSAFTRIEYAVSGGFLPFGGTPAAPSPNSVAFNIEAETTPGVWEVINSTTGFSQDPPHEGFREGVFDLREHAGKTARMRIYDNATGGWGHINIDTIKVSAIPAMDPKIAGSPLALFGDLTAFGAGLSPIAQTTTISNLGASNDLDITGLTIVGADAGLYSLTQSAPMTITPGNSTGIEVTFSPPAAGGSFMATLEIASNDLATPTFSIDLSAIVRTDPNIEVVVDDPMFGVVLDPASATRSVTIFNTGSAENLTISDVRLEGADAAKFSLGTVPTSIAPGGDDSFDVTFDDGGTPGTYVAQIEIDSNDGDRSTVTIPISARSLVPTTPGSLIAFYPFDNSSNPLEDASGMTGDASVGGGTPLYDPSNGFEGGYYQFTGADWLTAPVDINPTQIPHITMGAWVKTNTLTGLSKVMGHDDGAWDRAIGLDNRAEAAGGNGPAVTRYTAFTGGNNFGPVQNTPPPANVDDYTFLAVTYDDTNALVVVYVDLDAATTVDPLERSHSDTGLFSSTKTELGIGALSSTGGELWNGCIDNVFIFDGVLSPAEVTNLRDMGKAAFIAPDDNFRITNIVRNGDDTVTLTWNSNPAAGTKYKVRFNNVLTTPITDWPVDDDGGVDTQGTSTAVTTDNAFTQPQIFFAIEKQ